MVLKRTVEKEWQTLNVDSATTVRWTDEAVASLESWQGSYGAAGHHVGTPMTHAVTQLLGGGLRTVTTTALDGSYTVQTYDGDRVLESKRYDSGAILDSSTYQVDAHGRLTTSFDFRNQPTDTTYYDDDQVQSVAKPAPAAGQPRQTTVNSYDSRGRLWRVQLADGSFTYHTYWPTGETKTTTGSQTYDVSYAYDYAGRVQSLTANGATTSWTYSPERGFLTRKTYADSSHVDYTYTSAGRLLTRTWARGITTTNHYDTAGLLSWTEYSDGVTSCVQYTYSRRGMPDTITDAALVLLQPRIIWADLSCEPPYRLLKRANGTDSVNIVWADTKWEAYRRDFAVADPFRQAKTNVSTWTDVWYLPTGGWRIVN
jgi:YD repeat-containing protein